VATLPGITFTSWGQHYFVAIGKPELKYRQQATIETTPLDYFSRTLQ